MKSWLTRFYRHGSSLLSLMLGIAKGLDYKTLSRYILGISQTQSIDQTLMEVSQCLKEILNYRLFAFAIQEQDKLSAWIDPSIYPASLQNIIGRDFAHAGPIDFFHLNGDPPQAVRDRIIAFPDKDLLAYTLADKACCARLYILPNRRMLAYHDDIMQIIVKTLGVVLAHHLQVKRLENAASIDPLTGCYNRREFDRQLEHLLANVRRYDKDLSLIMFDIDHFKMINDTYGHPAGDRVLQQIAQAIKASIRKSDYLSRYGGEEFAVVLPNTRKVRAIELAERLRKTIAGLTFAMDDNKTLKVTASFGVAAVKKDTDRRQLVTEADTMLYQAKQSGRNKVAPALRVCPSPVKPSSSNPCLHHG